jgi:hypothetical protein
MVANAFQRAIESDKAFFHRDWQQPVTAHQQNTLRALAENEIKLTGNTVRQRYNLPASGSVSNGLKALVDRGLLYTTEAVPGYAFDNPFYKAWVHQRNQDDLGVS